MHKYLSSGTATWTASTRTISGATMSSVFSTDDQTYKRQVFFRVSTTLYYGTVDLFVSTTSISLRKGGSLPAVDGTIAELFVFDYPSTRTYQDYVDKVTSMVKDSAGKLTTADLDMAIVHAVGVYSGHVPMRLRKKITADGTRNYPLATILGSYFTPGITTIDSVEYPIDQDPLQELEDGDDYSLYDDGTAQDGSNLKLRLASTITNGDFFIVGFTAARSVPKVGTQNFPDNDSHFIAITLLAAAQACATLAAVYAQSIDKSISVDVVNYDEKTRKYRDLSRDYLKQYTLHVFGSDDASTNIAGAVVDKDVDLSSMDSGQFLFHSRKGS